VPDRLPRGRSQGEVARGDAVWQEEREHRGGRKRGGNESVGKAEAAETARATALLSMRGGGVAQEAIDATEQEELPLAYVADGDVCEQLRLVTIREQVR
jgi:hypothetical protein